MITVRAPRQAPSRTIDAALALGDKWYPLQLARELDETGTLERVDRRSAHVEPELGHYRRDFVNVETGQKVAPTWRLV